MIMPKVLDLRSEFLKGRPVNNVFGDRIPPPRRGDTLFRGAYDAENAAQQANACINYGTAAYRDGYRTAASALAQAACKNSSLLDIYVYPVIYLYRHSVEMTLKEIFEIAVRLLSRRPTPSEKRVLASSHDLQKLWTMVKPVLLIAWEMAGDDPLPPEDLAGIDSYIEQIHKYDPDGQRFRYSSTSKGNLSLAGAPLNINLRVMDTAMEILCSYLDGIEGSLDGLFQGGGN